MWVISETGFVSLVEDRDDPTKLQVRGRVREDIEAMFPEAEVYDLPGADYLHRARVNRKQVADTIRDAILTIDYTSHFKDHAIQTSPPNPERLNALYGCWEALAGMQAYRPYSRVPRAAEQRWWDDDIPEEDEDW